MAAALFVIALLVGVVVGFLVLPLLLFLIPVAIAGIALATGIEAGNLARARGASYWLWMGFGFLATLVLTALASLSGLVHAINFGRAARLVDKPAQDFVTPVIVASIAGPILAIAALIAGFTVLPAGVAAALVLGVYFFLVSLQLVLYKMLVPALKMDTLAMNYDNAVPVSVVMTPGGPGTEVFLTDRSGRWTPRGWEIQHGSQRAANGATTPTPCSFVRTGNGSVLLTADGSQWWDGARWVAVSDSVPKPLFNLAQTRWWNGAAWQARGTATVAPV